MSFARFMELALYHPVHGYYRNGRDPFGRDGDFYTAEQMQPVFGQLMASYVDRLAATFPLDGCFEVLELGAGRAELREWLARWSYQAVDWSGGSLPSELAGLVIANEFFDALPVHILKRKENGWCELKVLSRGKDFHFVETEDISPELCDHAERYDATVPLNGTLEVNLEMRRWAERSSALLREGKLLVIDYGYSSEELVRFPTGTLMAYRMHTASPNVLQDPGAQDVTAHVNFSELRRLMRDNGFRLNSDRTFAAWALSIWDAKELEKRFRGADQRWKLQWKQLVVGMGETFRVLELEKEAENEKPPRGPGGFRLKV